MRKIKLFWLMDEQMEWLKPFFPMSHGKPLVDDRRVFSSILFIIAVGCGGVLCSWSIAHRRPSTTDGSIWVTWVSSPG
jgi:transposase